MNTRLSLKVFIAVVIVLVGSAGLAFAHKGATGIVKERMDAMKDMSAQMKLMKKMIGGKEPFDSSKFSRAAATVAKHGTEMPRQFPKGSLQKPTRAKPDIWQDWNRFNAVAEDLIPGPRSRQ